ncbi:MaoC family dehydratase [Dokdonella immobilis]|uniref:Acyl dehydratase n=1 Tax=Dokdonella immobilis TaxID=578942 RepID=A0A1I4ZIV1_9GAMM|nr:MaoC family dehydratase [Dokdonella immobilis]SFN50174.1 Acyl dehydratase [Dokdonella immobilis]
MSTPRRIANLEALQALVGQEVAVSDWLTIDQARIQAFADVTEDHQWIHLDAERCRRESPYGAPIAHGYLILSLLPVLFERSLQIDGVAMAVNYGLDRVRLPAPVIAGSRIRGRLALERLDAVAGGMQAHWTATIEIESGDKPACVAQMLARYYPANPNS